MSVSDLPEPRRWEVCPCGGARVIPDHARQPNPSEEAVEAAVWEAHRLSGDAGKLMDAQEYQRGVLRVAYAVDWPSVEVVEARRGEPSEEASMNDVSRGPVQPVDRERAETKAKADLWQATWEASQFMDYAAIRDFVEGVLLEIERDEP